MRNNRGASFCLTLPHMGGSAEGTRASIHCFRVDMESPQVDRVINVRRSLNVAWVFASPETAETSVVRST